MAKRYVRGDRAFGRLLKQLPDAVATDIRKQMNETGRMLESRAKSLAPVYQGRPRKGLVSGALRDAISAYVTPVRLSLKVGLIGKAINRRLFYGRLIEFGHRLGNRATGTLPRLEPVRGNSIRSRLIRARRRAALRKTGVPPHPFLYTVPRNIIYAPFRDIWTRALRKAGAQSDD